MSKVPLSHTVMTRRCDELTGSQARAAAGGATLTLREHWSGVKLRYGIVLLLVLRLFWSVGTYAVDRFISLFLGNGAHTDSGTF